MPDPARAAAEAVEPAARPTPKLEPLTCHACGGPVPLTDEDSIPCPYCRAPVAVPPAYRALRDEERARTADRAAVEALYARIGKPPGFFLRAWAGAAGGAVWLVAKLVAIFLWVWVGLIGICFKAFSSIDDFKLLLVVLMIPFGALWALLWGLSLGLHGLAPTLGFDPIDTVSLGWSFFAVGVLLYLLFPLPMALYHYFEAFASVRQRLQACLAARPPKSAGGPSTCRQCGAALVVPSGALGVRCVYCRCDNLVALPPLWVAKVKEVSRDFHQQVETAEEEEQKAREAARKDATATIVLSLGLPILVGLLGWGMGSFGLIDARSGWHAAVAQDVALLPQGCDDPECPGIPTGTYDLAVRRGETVELTYRGDKPPDGVVLHRLGDDVPPIDLSWTGGSDALHARAVAAASGWWVLAGVDKKADWSVTVSPPRGRPSP